MLQRVYLDAPQTETQRILTQKRSDVWVYHNRKALVLKSMRRAIGHEKAKDADQSNDEGFWVSFESREG